MLTVARIRLHNWMRFRGDHEIVLSPGVHAVTAKWEHDRDRSNWGGKSSLLEAIPFAFYGWHRHGVEDDWITKGEKDGSVEIELTSPPSPAVVRILRARTRGKSTKISVSQCDEPFAMVGDEAQGFIIDYLGLTERDFFATCFIEQKQMDRFITERPEKRMELVVEWLRMQKLDEAAQLASKDITTRVQALSQLKAELASVSEQRGASLVSFVNNPVKSIDENLAELAVTIQSKIEEAVEQEAFAQETIRRIEAERDKLVSLSADFEAAREFAEVASRGKEIRLELKDVDDEVLRARKEVALSMFNEASARYRDAYKTEREQFTLSCGEFDGFCPLFIRGMLGSACPEKARINEMGAQFAKSHLVAKEALQSATRAVTGAKVAYTAIESECSRMQRLREDLSRLEQRARKLRPSVLRVAESKRDPNETFDESRLVAPRERLREVMQLKAQLESELTRVQASKGRAKTLAAAISSAETHLCALRKTRSILGRNGAQRELARVMIADVEHGANDALKECGIDLSVEIRWQHEGQGLAKTCENCGHQYGASGARVKLCPICGAERGPNLIDRMEVILSDRSGAAEDLAGAAVQLAAMAWLRIERQSVLSIAVLDEPLGALDKANRAALSSHLVAMLNSSYGVEQAFVIAHHPDVCDALPERIEITASSDGSRIAR